MMLWPAFALMTVVAILFVLWRVTFPLQPQRVTEDDLASNRQLFEDKLSQLRGQLDSGEIGQQQYYDLELEFQRQFLADNPAPHQQVASRGGRWLVLAIALLIPLAAAVLYLNLGAATELDLRQQLEQRSALFMNGKVNTPEMKAATGRVIETMTGLAEKHPDNPTYPVLLARLYADEGNYQQAEPYYLKATVLLPEDGLLLAEYAQLLFFAAGNRMTDRVEQLAMQALQLTPQNQTALSLAGIASFHGGKYSQAIEYWSAAIAMLPPDAPSRAALEAGMAAAKERGGEVPQNQHGAGVSLTVQVSLHQDIQLPDDATVFVYARTWQGSPMPLAISKLQVADLPAEVQLTEAMAMTPAMSLATVEQVEIVARVSLTGAPTASPGDYQATAGPINVKTLEKPLSLSIISRIAE